MVASENWCVLWIGMCFVKNSNCALWWFSNSSRISHTLRLHVHRLGPHIYLHNPKHHSNSTIHPKQPKTTQNNPKPTEEYWAITNLILSVAGIVVLALVVIWLLLYKKQKQNNNDDVNEDAVKQKQYRTIWLATAIVMAIACIIVFLITENINNTMTIVDKWTIANATIFIIEIIAIALTFKNTKKQP